MNILLLNPPAEKSISKEGRCSTVPGPLSRTKYNWPPISLAFASSILKKDGFTTKVVDGVADRTSFSELKQIFKAFDPNIVVVNSVTSTFNLDVRLIRQLKKQFKFKTIWVSSHVSVAQVKKIPEIDYMIRGEYELALSSVIKKLKKKQKVGFVTNAKAFDLDKLPLPDRTSFKKQNYDSPFLPNDSFTLVLAERGCPHKCTFCRARLIHGSEPRYRNHKGVVDEINRLVDNGIKDFVFYADTFTASKKWVLELCSLILKQDLDINWACNSRVDGMDKELSLAMSKAGCRIINMGVESCTPQSLVHIRKGTSLFSIKNAFDNCKQARIKTIASMIVGIPHEDIKQNIRFLHHIKPDLVVFNILTKYLGISNKIDYSRLDQSSSRDPELVRKMVLSYLGYYSDLGAVYRALSAIPAKKWSPVFWSGGGFLWEKLWQ